MKWNADGGKICIVYEDGMFEDALLILFCFHATRVLLDSDFVLLLLALQ